MNIKDKVGIKLILYIFCVLFNHNIYNLDRIYYDRINKLVESNPNQLSVNEYLMIAKFISIRSPCNFLVFGTGRDSSLWTELNKGKTVFLEDNNKWLNYAKKENPKIIAFLIKYDTKLNQWQDLLSKPSLLELALPNEIKNIKWDIIFVDAPNGLSDASSGRMKSIYTASVLAAKSPRIDIFVHDCDRIVEKTYCDKFLSKYNLVIQLNKLRYYRKNRGN